MKQSKAEIQIRSATIGRYLKERRKAAGLTQISVASRLRYKSSQFISNWERGLSLPPIDVLPKIVQIYQLPPLELIEVLHGYQEAMLGLTRKELLKKLKVARA